MLNARKGKGEPENIDVELSQNTDFARVKG
jgi:hypothetical protein